MGNEGNIYRNKDNANSCNSHSSHNIFYDNMGKVYDSNTFESPI
jgi:hypothetical protein